MRTLALYTLLAASLCTSPAAFADMYYADCLAMTGSSATLIVPQTALETSTITVGAGSEFAVFTANGTCAGHTVWEGGALALALWEDDPQTEDRDGFVVGEPLRLAVWDAASGTEHTDVQAKLDPSFTSRSLFASDAVYFVEALGEGSAFGSAERLNLEPNFPNPFVDATTIRYAITEPADVQLNVYNLLGQHVAELVNEPQEPGAYEEIFVAPAHLSNGTYIYRLTTGDFSEFHRMVLVR